MHLHFRFYTCFILIILVFGSCKKEKQIQRALYFWKSEFSLTTADEQYLKQAQITRLYVRMFDITWNKSYNRTKPEAIVNIKSNVPDFIEIIPVIYIANEVFKKEKDLTMLVENTSKLLKKLSSSQNISYKEIQFDCDWTPKSKTAFFSFISQIKKQFPGTQLSATLRLHQIKYPKQTGIPPVDRGILKFYNMGHLDSLDMNNSIFDAQIASAYLSGIPSYPVSFDIALPAFSWAVHSRKGKILGLINDLTADNLKEKAAFSQVNEKYWKADSSFFFQGNYFKAHDILKIETLTPELTKESAKLLVPHLRSASFCVSLFAFNQHLKTHYDSEDLEAIFSTFK